MDGRIDEIREALIKLRAFAKSFDCDYQDECTPGDDDMCQSCKHVYIADQALAALSAIDTKAIRREFWNELHAMASVQYDRRLELLGPIETLDDAAFRKTLGDGWSAWLLARRIIENRKARESNL